MGINFENNVSKGIFGMLFTRSSRTLCWFSQIDYLIPQLEITDLFLLSVICLLSDLIKRSGMTQSCIESIISDLINSYQTTLNHFRLGVYALKMSLTIILVCYINIHNKNDTTSAFIHTCNCDDYSNTLYNVLFQYNCIVY